MELKNLDIAGVKEAASEISSNLSAGDVLCLYGTLGSGKTTFTQFLVEALGGKVGDVTSPTFNILHIYDTTHAQVWHFDLYRLEEQKEIYELGIEDAFQQAITIIEWPEIIEKLIPKHAIKVLLSISQHDQNQRDISISTDLS